MNPTVVYTILALSSTVSEVISDATVKKQQVLPFNLEPKVLNGKDFNAKLNRLEDLANEHNLQETQTLQPLLNVQNFDKTLKSFQDLLQELSLNEFVVSKRLHNNQDIILKSLYEILLTDENLRAFVVEVVKNNKHILETLRDLRLSHDTTKNWKPISELEESKNHSQNLLPPNVEARSSSSKQRELLEHWLPQKSNLKQTIPQEFIIEMKEKKSLEDFFLKALQRNSRESRDKKKSINEASLNVTARAKRHGFSTQEYTVQTEDGYVLGLQRIWIERASQNEKRKRVPVLLMHGLLLSATCWLDGGLGAGLAYLLARAGHDVWLGNARGSYYSRRHVTLDPDFSSTFWQFCADEIGKYDLPALIDKVLNETGDEKLNYIGFSQGGGTFFMMCSELPHYCQKVKVMIALAPSGRHLLSKSPVFRLLSKFYEKNEKKLIDAGIFEVMPKNGWVQQFFNVFCPKSDLALRICELLKDISDGPHPGSLTKEAIMNMAANFPSGTSVHNMARFGQIVRAKAIHKFDYGPERNLQVYGSSKPPIYNLSATTVPVVVIYGRNDGVVDVRDVKWLISKLPNVIESFEVEDPLWTHTDMTYSQYVPKLLYPKIEEYLNIYK